MRTMPPRKRIDRGTALYRWRHAAALTQAEAARKFGVALSTYKRLEVLRTLPKRYELAFRSLRGR